MAVRNWNPTLTRGSHRKVLVLCDWAISPNCRREWTKEWHTVVRDRERSSDGTDICLACSRARKTGTDNPNCRYRDLDEDFFQTIDTEAKAYFLGWIASDGSVGSGQVSLEVHRKDRELLGDLLSLVSPESSLAERKQGRHVAFALSRKKIVEDVCRHLGIKPGPKSTTVRFPDLLPELERHFIRGLFDGDGSIRDAAKYTTPACHIASSSSEMKTSLVEKTKRFHPRENSDAVYWEGVNALDFMGWLYEDSSWRLTRKYDLYLDWTTWVPMLGGPGNSGRGPWFHWTRLHPDAVAPTKSRVSDSGFDVTLIGDRDDHGNFVRLYRTGIRIKPAHGWYFDLVPRSSIIKSGYMMANSIGVIDRAYRGEVLVPLIKVNPDAPDLEFPCRLVQLVPRPIVHVQMEEVDELSDSSRGEGGFGSTGA